jgi:TIR domain/HEAT repeats
MAESAGDVRGRIFMSYRRDDTEYPAAWLFGHLAAHFGRGPVFKDDDKIEPGEDFVEVIQREVESCDVLLALIGRHWLTEQDGQRRLDNPGDFVRLEIEAALTRNVRVIPILLGAAQVPRADELPASLAKLPRRQALKVRAEQFDYDTRRLLEALERVLAEAPERRRQEAEGAARSSARPGVSSAATPGQIASGQFHPNLGDVQATADEIDQGITWTDTSASLSPPSADAPVPASPAENFRAIVLGFDSPDVNVRNNTAREVRDIAALLELEDVLGFCRSRKTAERVGGAIALGVHLRSSQQTQRDPRVLSALSELLTDRRSSLVRYRAAELLQWSPTLVPEYYDQLRHLAETDENSWVRRRAAKALQAARRVTGGP